MKQTQRTNDSIIWNLELVTFVSSIHFTTEHVPQVDKEHSKHSSIKNATDNRIKCAHKDGNESRHNILYPNHSTKVTQRGNTVNPNLQGTKDGKWCCTIEFNETSESEELELLKEAEQGRRSENKHEVACVLETDTQ